MGIELLRASLQNEPAISRPAELAQLKEVLRGSDSQLIQLPDGYIVHNRAIPYRAEAPIVALDFDDTAAMTTADKARCGGELKGLGLSDRTIRTCDKMARVSVDDSDPMYKPELDMRLLTAAMAMTESELLGTYLNDLKDRMLKDPSKFPIDPRILGIYYRTRYTSTLYPDTQATLRQLREDPERPSNVVIFTYGDPRFQLEKTLGLLKSGLINQIWLTTTRKGTFFKEILDTNPFREIPMEYTYPETEKGVGVDFRKWHVMVVLFDDDPNQVASFNELAKKEGLLGLGVVRVRRQNIKRSGDSAIDSRMGLQMTATDSYLDSELYARTYVELQLRALENFLADQVSKKGVGALNLDPNLARILETLESQRGEPEPDPIRRIESLAAET